MDQVGLGGSLLGPALLIIFVLLIWDRRRSRKRSIPVADASPDEPYRVYSKSFDLELRAEAIPDALRDSSLDHHKGWTDRYGSGWTRAIELAEKYEADDLTDSEDLFSFAASDGERGPMAITFLVDQSGSLRGEPMARVAAAMRPVARQLEQHGIVYEILGFSTTGWHGGRAYAHWLSHGRRSRPGRLCALLHIVYKSAEDVWWSEASKRAMLHPDILRENVDGEALEWAFGRLVAVDAQTRLLIVLSDGAPVDDATLMQNGPSFLERHLQKVISSIETAGTVRIGAVGLGFSVGRYYTHSCASDLVGVQSSIMSLIADLLDGPRSAAEQIPSND